MEAHDKAEETVTVKERKRQRQGGETASQQDYQGWHSRKRAVGADWNSSCGSNWSLQPQIPFLFYSFSLYTYLIVWRISWKQIA